MHAEVDVQQVDVPRQFAAVQDVGFDDLPRNGQRRVLRVVVDVTVRGAAQFRVLLGEQPDEQRFREFASGLRTRFRIGVGQARATC